jgi:poly-beta-1,6-N-acetyl-D-glucosamine synthase
MTLAIVTSSVILKPHPLDSPLLSIVRAVIVFFATVLLTKYTVYMFLCPWFSLMASREDDLVSHFVRDYQPLVSVMIPAWNEECGLLSTVKSLLASTYKNLEIVVVNDGSTDRSDAMMRNFIEKYEREMTDIPGHVKIIYHYQQNGGKGSALNAAIKLAHGDILVSIDADCIVHKRAVAAFVKAFRDPRVMAAVGNVRIGNTKTLVGTVQYLEFVFSFMMKKADSLFNTIYIIGGAAGAFRREVFNVIGGYSTKNITEDIALSMAIQDQGWKIVYVPDALVFTEGASTLQGLMKQRLRWKRGRFQTFWEFRHMFFSLNPRHNKLLCWLILPITLFSEVQLGLEPLFLLILYLFSFMSGDFTAFVSGIIVVSLMFAVQAWDIRDEQSPWYMALAPIGWLLFYVCTFVEVYSLTKSIWMHLRKQEMTWQRWQRKGVTDQ